MHELTQQHRGLHQNALLVQVKRVKITVGNSHTYTHLKWCAFTNKLYFNTGYAT